MDVYARDGRRAQTWCPPELENLRRVTWYEAIRLGVTVDADHPACILGFLFLLLRGTWLPSNVSHLRSRGESRQARAGSLAQSARWGRGDWVTEVNPVKEE